MGPGVVCAQQKISRHASFSNEILSNLARWVETGIIDRQDSVTFKLNCELTVPSFLPIIATLMNFMEVIYES